MNGGPVQVISCCTLSMDPWKVMGSPAYPKIFLMARWLKVEKRGMRHDETSGHR